MTQKNDFVGKEATFVSKSTTLPVGMKDLIKGHILIFITKIATYMVFTLNVFIPYLSEMMLKKCTGILEERQSCMMFLKNQFKLKGPMPENS